VGDGELEARSARGGLYEERMKIEQTFKDSKGLLDMEKVMNKKRGHLQITVALGL
jgi:hypothetical protein